MSNFDAVGGAVKCTSLSGNGLPLNLGRSAVVMTDANYTALAADYTCRTIDITGTLTAGRNFVMPLTDGAEWVVKNGTGQAVTVIGATGTGIAIATTKTAIVRCDGTNILRVTADA